MRTKIINGNVLYDGRFAQLPLILEDGKILAVGKDMDCDRVIDAKGHYVTSGFVDIHCHGGGGFDFNDGTEEAVRAAVKAHLRFGTTSIFPTVTSSDMKNMKRGICALEAVMSELPSIAGIHLEGPYFSPAQLGAQDGSAVKPPHPDDYEPILKAHRIARWDYAPETDADLAFLQALHAHNVIPSAAHTDATCAQMEAVADQGCQLITHLYSATSTVRREHGFRIAGVLEAAYLRDDVKVELIADGCHLPNELLRLVYKLKGADRIALVTDSMRVAGTEIESGEFMIGATRCIIEDGVAKLPDRSAFAGSIATADRLVRTCVRAGIPLADTVKMMTETPASIMGLQGKGRIEVGYDADIVIFDEDIQIKTVILGGEEC